MLNNDQKSALREILEIVYYEGYNKTEMGVFETAISMGFDHNRQITPRIGDDDSLIDIVSKLRHLAGEDKTTPKCPECKSNNYVRLGDLSWQCPPCDTSLIP